MVAYCAIYKLFILLDNDGHWECVSWRHPTTIATPFFDITPCFSFANLVAFRHEQIGSCCRNFIVTFTTLQHRVNSTSR
jgi:hypothetical protein